MKQVLDWLVANDKELVADLARLVAIPSISTDGEHQQEIDKAAELTCDMMRCGRAAKCRRPAGRGQQSVFLWRMARRSRQTHHLSLRPSRRAADQLLRRLAFRSLDADRARRPILRPRGRRRQGGHHRPARRHRRLAQDGRARCPSTSRCSSKGRKRSARAIWTRSSRKTRIGSCPTPSSSATRRTSRSACPHSPIRCAASSRPWSRSAAPPRRSTAAWPGACWPTPPSP